VPAGVQNRVIFIKEIAMNNTGRTTLMFLAGLGIGVGAALLFAPRSGEETREWIADTAKREFKMLRRSGRRSVRQLHDTLAKGEAKFTEMLRDGKEALALVATKLV
jgi:gas vesicle protein